jgi:molecular chaperone DnaK
VNVGIDLGTTYSLVARMDPSGCPALMPDHADHDVLYTPSAVILSGDGCAFVGHLAELLAEQEPDLNTIRFFKRQFGGDRPIYYDRRGAAWYPESVAALVLRKLAFDAESYTSSRLEGAVITVPAHFNDLQRKSELAAAALADVRVLALLDEPVAAALHYGVATASRDQVLLVYDLGGGTFDATVLSMDHRGVYVLAKDGLTELGGKEFDEKIAEMVLTQFERAGVAPTLNARTLQQLRSVAEEIKIELGLPGRLHVRRVVLLGGHSVEVVISRREFEAAIGEAAERTVSIALRCLEGAGLKPRDVNALLLVGGSSMVPAVAERMRALFTDEGQRVLFHEPMKAVAFGAAIHAAQLTGDAELFQLPPELRGVTGHNVGVRAIDPRTGRPKIDTLIKKNMPLPARARKIYYTARPDQERIMLEVVQYRESPEDAVSLGQLRVGPLPAPRQNYPIQVTIENRDDCTVVVQAADPETGLELRHVFGRDTNDVFGNLAAQRALVRSTVINNL